MDLRKEMCWKIVDTIVKDGVVGINKKSERSNYNKLDWRCKTVSSLSRQVTAKWAVRTMEDQKSSRSTCLAKIMANGANYKTRNI